MSSPAHAKPNTQLWKTEPAMVGAAALWIVTQIGQFLVGHEWLTKSQWNGSTAVLIAGISAALYFGIAWIVRKAVIPIWKKAEEDAAKAGIQLPPELVQALYALTGVSATPLAGQPPSTSAPTVPAATAVPVATADAPDLPAPVLDGQPVVEAPAN